MGVSRAQKKEKEPTHSRKKKERNEKCMPRPLACEKEGEIPLFPPFPPRGGGGLIWEIIMCLSDDDKWEEFLREEEEEEEAPAAQK